MQFNTKLYNLTGGSKEKEHSKNIPKNIKVMVTDYTKSRESIDDVILNSLAA